MGAAQGADPLEDCDGHLSCSPEDLRSLLHAAGQVAGHGEGQGQGQGQGEAGTCPRSWPQVPLQQLRLWTSDGSCLPAWHVGRQLQQQLERQQQDEDEEVAGREGLEGEVVGAGVGLVRRGRKGRWRAAGKGSSRDARRRGVRRRGTRGVGVGMGQEGLVAALDGDAEQGSQCLGAGGGDGQGLCAWAGRDAGLEGRSREEQEELGVQQQEVQQGWAAEAGGPQEEDAEEDAVEGKVLEEGAEEGSAAADGEVDGVEEGAEQQEGGSSGREEAGDAGAGGAARGRRGRRRERPPSDEAPEWALEAAMEGACRGMPTAAAKLVGHTGTAKRKLRQQQMCAVGREISCPSCCACPSP